jgi:hypothetical protein
MDAVLHKEEDVTEGKRRSRRKGGIIVLVMIA